jgi:hypothetical protein
MKTMLEHLQSLSKGDQISLILAGMIVDGTFEELVDDCVVLADATSPSIKKKRYSLKIPVESIYAWGNQEKKDKKKKKGE